MIRFKQFIVERSDTQRHAVMAYMRANPPTIGHAKVLDKVFSTAGHHHVVISHTQDNKKNPLSGEEKRDIVRTMYPGQAQSIHTSTKEEPTLMHHAAKLHRAGFKHLTVVAGDDRVGEYHKLLNSYNGKFDDKGNGYKFDSIHVVSSGARDPDAEGTEGMSATKMREAAMKGDEKTFKSGLHPKVQHMAKDLMGKIKERLAPNEAK